MAYLVDLSNISREREFATGCLVFIIRKRNPNMCLEFLNTPQQDENSDGDSDEEFDKLRDLKIELALSNYGRIYEAIDIFATDNIAEIEAKYCSFFTEHMDLAEPHIKNFMELVSRYAYGLYEKPFSCEIIIAFCAHLSLFGYMSYQAKGLQQAVKYAISSITYVLTYYGFNDTKYDELRLFVENFF